MLRTNNFSYILFDRYTILKYNLSNIMDLFIYDLKKIKREFAIVICLTNKKMDYINKLEPLDKIKYINNTKFIKNIKFKFLLLYGKLSICEIWEFNFNNKIHTLNILNNLNLFVNDKNIKFWLHINYNFNNHNSNQDRIIKLIIKTGFHSPHICNKSPFGSELEKNVICFYKNNCNVIPSITYNNFKYLVKQYSISNNICTLNAKFTENAIKELRKIPFKNKNEISGSLTIINNKKENDDIIFYIDIINDTLNEGDKEDIVVINDKYNFHSHPIDAYIRHNVNYAWPSSQDYLGFLNASIEVGCIFHVVTTKEGIYIISISKDYVDSFKEYYKDPTYILDNFNIKKTEFDSPYKYIEYVNNNLKIFNIAFLPWDKINSQFRVNFPVYYSQNKSTIDNNDRKIKNCFV